MSGERSCGVIEWLAPEKLVCDGMSFIKPFLTYQRIPRSVKKLVTIMVEKGYSGRGGYGDDSDDDEEDEDEEEDPEDEEEQEEDDDDRSGVYGDGTERLASSVGSIYTNDGSTWPAPTKKAEWWPAKLSLDALSTVNHLVYIFFSSNVHTTGLQDLRPSRVKKTRHKFAEQMFEKIRQMRPAKITIVNSSLAIPNFKHSSNWSDTDTDYREWRDDGSDLESYIRQRWNAWTDLPETAAGSDKPIELEFLGLETYLQGYDWTGEFDEEVIKPWSVPGLADRMRERHRQAELAKWKADEPRRRREAEREYRASMCTICFRSLSSRALMCPVERELAAEAEQEEKYYREREERRERCEREGRAYYSDDDEPSYNCKLLASHMALGG